MKKQTKLYQKCPQCKTEIEIPRTKQSFLGTPYFRWEFASNVECPNCKTTHLLEDFSCSLPTRVDVETTLKI